jgi:hypothetical protein
LGRVGGPEAKYMAKRGSRGHMLGRGGYRPNVELREGLGAEYWVEWGPRAKH